MTTIPKALAETHDATPAAEASVLDVHDVTVAYHRRPVLWDVDLTIAEPGLIGIVGPNGAGKSTLIKAILGLVPLASGRVSAFGQPVDRQRRRIGYVPQRESVDWDFPVNVLDVVLMGTYGRLGWFRRPGRQERAWALECLRQVGLADLARQQIGQLSGGQQQRTFLARALAQQADLYFMDEPMAGVDVELPELAVAYLYTEIGTTHEAMPSKERFERAAHTSTQSARHRREAGGYLETPGRLFNQWLTKSRSDLALLTTPLSTGPYPYAGIPWFSTQFGRDAVITALQTLWLDPRLAGGVLRFLASTQATETSAFRDSEPGKIMHEMRRGEMARLREIPFGCYYGAVDTTPLFLMLAGAYEARTGDRSLIDEIWPHLQAAAEWIERRLEQSRTGFLDYVRGEKTGLANQAWKDSQDSIFHADGRIPQGPIAVVEVQGYACAALEAMAQLGASREEPKRSSQWRARAQRLREAIEERFWLPSLSFYAIALDGEGEPCYVQGSNAGHLLFCGVPSPQHAKAVATRLLSEEFCTGWGIRTLQRGEHRYNPMSYHNGSVWPHDTSICASGIARYGQRECVVKILADVFEAANHFSMRLPELYCGFPRAAGQGPVPYPVACLPQAWASGSLFMLLQAALGIRIEGARKEVHIERPLLPEGIESLRVRQIPVGEARIDIEFHRLGNEVGAFPVGHAQGGVNVLLHL